MTKPYGMLVMAVLPALALWGLAARAQAPAGSAPHKIYTNRPAFKLPLQVDEKERAQLQEVQLYVKNGPTAAWTLKESVAPTQKEFIYRAMQDGEYWFCVVTVDKAGKTTPADLNQEPPGLIVVVDKQPPEIDVRPIKGPSGQMLLHCDVRDANPDPAKTSLEYLAPNQTWQALEPVSDQPGLFRATEAVSQRGIVRATAIDRAGNKTSREIPLQSAMQSAVPFPGPQTVQPASATLPEAAPGMSATEVRADKKSATPVPASSGTSRQVINSTHTALKYQIDQMGPSGVGKVEVWMTRDEGQTWQRLCEDPSRRSPVAIELPGEGTYGLSLVVTNGNGHGGAPPVKGDAPDFRLEVDTTKPVAQLLAVRAGSGNDAGTFLITWTASDKNLKSEPIDLFYANHVEGPWLPIVKGLKNDGNYRWPAPPDLAGEIFVRMEVMDEAGNVTTGTTSQPVVMDRSHPKTHIVGVATGGQESATAKN